MALVANMSDPHDVQTKNGPRVVTDVTITDGSQTDDGKVADILLQMWFKTDGLMDEYSYDAFKACADAGTPLCFFALVLFQFPWIFDFLRRVLLGARF